MRQRPLRLEGQKLVRAAGGKAPSRRPRPGAGAGDAGQLLRRVQQRHGGTCTHVLVRPDKVLYRVDNEADLDEIIREHCRAARWSSGCG